MNGKTRLLWLLFTINNYFTFLVVFADLCSGTCTKIYMTALSKCCRTLHNYTCFGHICQSLWMNICHNVFVQWKNIKPSQIFWAFKRVDLRYELHFRAFGWKSNFPIESLWFMQNRCKWKNIYEVNTHPKVFTLQVKQAKRRPALKQPQRFVAQSWKDLWQRIYKVEEKQLLSNAFIVHVVSQLVMLIVLFKVTSQKQKKRS